MSPISPPPWHYTTFPEALDHWQSAHRWRSCVRGRASAPLSRRSGVNLGSSSCRLSEKDKKIDASREDAEKKKMVIRSRTPAPPSRPRRPFVWSGNACRAKPSHFPLCSTAAMVRVLNEVGLGQKDLSADFVASK